MRVTQPENVHIKKPPPFSRNLKGVFFFLVTLILVSQVSPLLVLSRLITQEEDRVGSRMGDALADLRAHWMHSKEHHTLDLHTIARQHNLRQLTISEFIDDTLGGRWYHRTTGSDADDATGWDSVTEFPLIPAPVRTSAALQVATLSDIWETRPVQVSLSIGTPVLAGLRRHLRAEMWLRSAVLLSFIAFTFML